LGAVVLVLVLVVAGSGGPVSGHEAVVEYQLVLQC
jgi:hypothetical protein